MEPYAADELENRAGRPDDVVRDRCARWLAVVRDVAVEKHPALPRAFNVAADHAEAAGAVRRADAVASDAGAEEAGLYRNVMRAPHEQRGIVRPLRAARSALARVLTDNRSALALTGFFQIPDETYDESRMERFDSVTNSVPRSSTTVLSTGATATNLPSLALFHDGLGQTYRLPAASSMKNSPSDSADRTFSKKKRWPAQVPSGSGAWSSGCAVLALLQPVARTS